VVKEVEEMVGGKEGEENAGVEGWVEVALED